jgi:hypothetical protein
MGRSYAGRKESAIDTVTVFAQILARPVLVKQVGEELTEVIDAAHDSHVR